MSETEHQALVMLYAAAKGHIHAEELASRIALQSAIETIEENHLTNDEIVSFDG